MKTSTLYIMVKAPVAGRVKTRLGAGMGLGASAARFRSFINITLRQACAGQWRTVLAVDGPDATLQRSYFAAYGLPMTSQGKGNLGDRMRYLLSRAPVGPVMFIGADAPQLRTIDIADGFAALNGKDAVFGPAHDGGYWLIGLARRRPSPQLFENVRWSTKYALADTVASLPDDFKTGRLRSLRDVDEVDDLKALDRAAYLASVNMR